jgi:hypothetical protein
MVYGAGSGDERKTGAGNYINAGMKGWNNEIR